MPIKGIPLHTPVFCLTFIIFSLVEVPVWGFTIHLQIPPLVDPYLKLPIPPIGTREYRTVTVTAMHGSCSFTYTTEKLLNKERVIRCMAVQIILPPGERKSTARWIYQNGPLISQNNLGLPDWILAHSASCQ